MNAEQARKYSDDVNAPTFHDTYKSIKGRIGEAVDKGLYEVRTTLVVHPYVSRLLHDEGYRVHIDLGGTTVSW